MPASSLSHLLHSNTDHEVHLSPPVRDSSQAVSHPAQPSASRMTYNPIPAAHPPPQPPSTSLNSPSNVTQFQNADDLPIPTSQSHSVTRSLYQCADCKKRYSRPEHLARHIQTHTLGKRFFCPVCGKAFARADLVKRHTANHENDGDRTKKRRRADSSPGAGRVSQACRPCAAARVKCEEIKPCSRCRNRQIDCEVAPSEAGSAAALHLSVNAQNNTSSHGPSPTVSSNTSPMAYQDQEPLPNPGQAVDGGAENMSATFVKTELGQQPTPGAMVDQNNFTNYPNVYATNGVVNMARLPFSDFLRDVLYDQSMDPSRLAETQGLAVLDFCDDTSYELNDVDYGLLDHWNLDGANNDRPPVIQAATPQTDDSAVDMTDMRQKLVKIWTESPWRWDPNKRDHGYGEHGNLPLSLKDTASQTFNEKQKRMDRVVKDKLDQSSRDKILSIVLSTCQSDTMKMRVASSFPSADVMDTLTHVFLAATLCSVSGWIHFATFDLNSQWPEWLAVAAASGAVSTPVPTLRKFGFAVQEAVRLAIPAKFELNNIGIRDLGLVQTLVLGQDIGLWSGSRRKMEIAECHLLIPINMMRYRGRFQRSSYPSISVSPADEGDILEEKWKRWYEMESWKRLVFHCYLRDAQASMTTLACPTMSYAELTLPLPESKELWFAKTASEWKQQYLLRSPGQSGRPPCLGDLIRDINLLTANHGRLDAQYAMSIYLHGFWNLVFEWRQLNSVLRSDTFLHNNQAGPNLILNSRHQELCKALANFQLVTADWHATLSAQESMLLNLMLLNLHVSLDHLQLFAGKEGEDQARRVYPILQQWSESPEARQALWHAGQIFRQAKLFPPGHLKNFYSVAVHHAALALWAYGVVTKATRNQPDPSVYQHEAVYIDGTESTQVQRFVGFGQGRPTVRGPRSQGTEGVVEAGLDDPKACMDVAQEVLRANFSNGQDLLPPMVENLCHLIGQLGGAALAVGL
ncbi:hypothetical protein F4779DRAFT_605364 [Xylariaceae sp. FL0662B]|nr:hypothetical protein F4779DRAFT_605364 [Xylariaceae sp. FL0662B]